MGQRTGRKWLDGDSRGSKRPGAPEFIHDCGRIVGATESMKKSTGSFENALGAGPADIGQFCRKDADLGCMTGVKRLHHGAEILAQAAGLTGGDSESALCAGFIKTVQLRT